MQIKTILCIVVLAISACQSVPETSVNLTDCPDIRPQVCTMIYAPVCAMEKDGSFTTYSSDCTACSHIEVIGFQLGMCDKSLK